MTQMENRIVLCSSKMVMVLLVLFLHLEAYSKCKWKNYEKNGMIKLKISRRIHRSSSNSTCLRNHAFIQEVAAGGGPIQMVTTEAFQDPHLETVGWEKF